MSAPLNLYMPFPRKVVDVGAWIESDTQPLLEFQACNAASVRNVTTNRQPMVLPARYPRVINNTQQPAGWVQNFYGDATLTPPKSNDGFNTRNLSYGGSQPQAVDELIPGVNGSFSTAFKAANYAQIAFWNQRNTIDKH